MNIIQAQKLVLVIAMIFLSITTLICLIRTILGPRFTDRILGINVINVKVIILICIVAAFDAKAYLADISLLYAVISFLSVVVLARLFLKDYLKSADKTIKRKGGERDGIN